MNRLPGRLWRGQAGLALAATLLVGGWSTAGQAGPLEDIGRLQQETTRLGREQQALQTRVGDLDRILADAEARLQREAQAEQVLRGRLRRHVLALDRLGRSGSLALLLLAPSLRDLHRREGLLRHGVRAERELLRQASTAHRALREARDEAERVRGDVARALEELRRTEQDLQRQIVARQELAQRIQHDPAISRATGLELDSSARSLRELVERRPADPADIDRLPPLLSRKGSLSAPSIGRLALNFGVRRNPKLHTEVRHLGVDFFAAIGTPVNAVHPGSVVHAGPLPGYGQVVILAHGLGYHTVYAQLEAIDVKLGTLVAQGAVLGRVGPDLLEEPPHLHFELRYRGQAQDPKAWFARPAGGPETAATKEASAAGGRTR